MSQTPRDTAGLNLDADNGDAPAFWRCLCCPFSTTSYDAILEHGGETGHGFVADNAHRTLLEQSATAAHRLDALELAWGIIANASGGDWTKESPEWQAAAARWRDGYLGEISTALAERSHVASAGTPPLADLLEANRTYQAEHAPGFPTTEPSDVHP